MTPQEPSIELDLDKLFAEAQRVTTQGLDGSRAAAYPWLDQFFQLCDAMQIDPQIAAHSSKATLTILGTIPELADEMIEKRAREMFDEDPMVAAAKALIFGAGTVVGAAGGLPPLVRSAAETLLPALLGPSLTAAAMLLNEAHNRRQAHGG